MISEIGMLRELEMEERTAFWLDLFGWPRNLEVEVDAVDMAAWD